MGPPGEAAGALVGAIAGGLDRPLVAQEGGEIGVGEHIGGAPGFAVDEHRRTEQANAVAVVRVPIAVHGAEWLNRLPFGAVPAVEGDPVPSLAEAVRHDNVFLVPGDQPDRVAAAELRVDERVMAGEGLDAHHRIVGRERTGRQTGRGEVVNEVDDLRGRQHEAETVGDDLR